MREKEEEAKRQREEQGWRKKYYSKFEFLGHHRSAIRPTIRPAIRPAIRTIRTNIEQGWREKYYSKLEFLDQHRPAIRTSGKIGERCKKFNEVLDELTVMEN